MIKDLLTTDNYHHLT